MYFVDFILIHENDYLLLHHNNKQIEIMTTLNTQTVIEYTNAKLQNWYKNAKIDYNVNGSAETSFDLNTNEYVINYIENGVKAQFRLNIYDEKIDYLFNAWMEFADIEEDCLC